ncbi:MAG: hypothetical protein ACOC0A_01445 [Planctomycetota bacterium]
MESVLMGVGAFVSWVVMCALSLFLVTVFWVVTAKKLEHYLVITDRWTFWIWIVTLALCPGMAFGGNWVIWGMFLPERYYEPVRLGWLWAGLAMAVVVLGFMVLPVGKRKEGTSEVAMLTGAVVIDLVGCFILTWHFQAIADFMQSL